MRAVRLAMMTAVCMIVAAGCTGSGGGSVTVPPGVTRPPGAGNAPSVTEPPATRPPPSAGPVTRPSATEPEETDPPVTDAPDRTPAHDQTDAPSESSTTTTTSGEENGSSTTTWWPWVLLVLALLAIIVGITALLRRRRSPQWPAQAAAALDESDAITTHLVALAPAGLAAVAGSDAARLATLTATLERLMTTAPDDPSRRAIAEIHEPLRALHARLDAVALRTTAPSQQDVDDLTTWATALHAATSFARARLVPPGPQRPPG